MYNVKRMAPSLETPEAEKYAEFDTIETIEGIRNAIEANGHEVHMVEADEKAYGKLMKLKAEGEVDLVFNIAEGLGGEARESHIPAMLEMLNIPYTGSGPLAMAITLDKARTKEILSHHGIPNAKFQVFHSGNEKLGNGLSFPLVVKPVAEGSSKGIKNDCFVKNEYELRRKVNEIISKYRQSAIAEEFLEGREFTAGILGNGASAKVLPIIEVDFSYLPEGTAKIDSYEAKWIWDDCSGSVDPLTCPAKLTNSEKKEIEELALRTFHILGCKDWSRLDMRMDRAGMVKVIEVNALPGIIPDEKENSRFPRAARAAGLDFQKMVGEIINAAAERYNMKYYGKK